MDSPAELVCVFSSLLQTFRKARLLLEHTVQHTKKYNTVPTNGLVNKLYFLYENIIYVASASHL